MRGGPGIACPDSIVSTARIRMNHQRRVVLKRTVQAGAAIVVLTGPQRLWAKWPAAAFDAANLDAVLSELGADPDGSAAIESDRILIDVPDLVDNPAIVAVRVSTDLPDVETISILVEDNQIPLAASFELFESTEAIVSTRIRLEHSGRIVALVKTSSGYYLNGSSVDVRAFECAPIKVKQKVQHKKAEAKTE